MPTTLMDDVIYVIHEQKVENIEYLSLPTPVDLLGGATKCKLIQKL